MSERSGSEKRKRTKSVNVRFTPKEFDLLQRDAKTLGLSLPGYIRDAAISTAVHELGIDWTEED